MSITNLCRVLCICILLSVSAFSQDKSGVASCRKFVTTFYTWYAGLSVEHDPAPPSDRALREKPYLFSVKLAQLLNEASAVQDRAGANLVGLDIDPFAGPDGRGDGFVIENVTVKNGHCLAEVHFVWKGVKDVALDVTPDMKIQGRSWVFVNFYYPDASDPKATNLLSDLKAERAEWIASGLLKVKKPNANH